MAIYRLLMETAFDVEITGAMGAQRRQRQR
jgi:hypothetical protein